VTEIAWPTSLDVRTSDASGTDCIDVPADRWADALLAARDSGYTMFDWLSAVDEPDAVAAKSDGEPDTDADAVPAAEAVRARPGVDVVVHLVAVAPLRRVLLRTRVVGPDLVLASATSIFAGAAWHERETYEMFGVDFTGFDDGTSAGLRPLLLPDGFEGTPLRKSFVLAARAVKAWPGAKEPGESDAGGAAPSRRKLLPPGVPDASWGPRAAADKSDAAGEDDADA
jgi:NADH-quinone oxidoreductase subunit C